MTDMIKDEFTMPEIDAYKVRKLVFSALDDLKSNYIDKKGNYKNVPLYFFWGYFKDHYSEYGCLMGYCQFWGIYYVDDLKSLTKEEFFTTWIYSNRDSKGPGSEGGKILWSILWSFKMEFNIRKRNHRDLLDLIIDYKGTNSKRAKELSDELKRERFQLSRK